MARRQGNADLRSAQRPAGPRAVHCRPPSRGAGMGPAALRRCLPFQCTDHAERWDSRREGTTSELGVLPAARLRRAVPTGGLYLSGHHFFMGQTACERMAPEGVRWGAAGSRGAASRGGRRRRFRAGRTSSGLVSIPRGASPFFLLPAMKLLPAHPRRRRHPEGRSAAEEARRALPSSPWMGTMLSSCRNPLCQCR